MFEQMVTIIHYEDTFQYVNLLKFSYDLNAILQGFVIVQLSIVIFYKQSQ